MDNPNLKRTTLTTFGFWFFVVWVFGCIGLCFFKIPLKPTQDFNYLLRSLENLNWTWIEVSLRWLDHLLCIVTLLGCLVVFQGTGNIILKLQSRSVHFPIEKWVWSLALGWIFWGLLAEGLALEKLMMAGLMRFVFVGAGIFLILLDRRGSFERCWPFRERVEVSGLWKWPIVLIAMLSLANLLAPEISWDAVTYQLVLPKFYFLNHGFYPVTGIIPAHYPSLGQMFFSWGLLWGNDSLARSFSFLAHLGTALALVWLGTRLSNSKLGWLAAVFYWVFPYLNIFSTRGYVDLFAGFYSVLGLGGLILFATNQRDRSKEEPQNLALTFGFLGTLTLGAVWAIKYNAFSFWLAGLAILGWGAYKRRIPIFLWMSLVGFPIFFFGTWALKSWIYTRNPLFPYFSQFFQTFEWTDFNQRASTLKFATEGLSGLLKMPQVLWGVFFKNYGGAPNEEVSLVPLLFFPLIFAWRRKVEWKIPLLLSCFIPFVFWLTTSHQLRLVSAVIALGSLGLAAGYENVVTDLKKIEKTATYFISFLLWVCFFYLFQGLIQQPNPFAYFIGLQSRSDFLKGILLPRGYVPVADYLNSRLSTDSKVLILGQQNGYYLNRVSAFDFDYTYPVLKKMVDGANTSGEIYNRFKKNGFTHILYNSNAMMGTVVRIDALGLDRFLWKKGEIQKYEQFFLRFTRRIPLPVADGYALYEVCPRVGFSYLPEYLPGTERFYLENVRAEMGLSRLSEIVGKKIPAAAYINAYELLSRQQLEMGYPSFQWAFAKLSTEPLRSEEVLKIGKEGFSRNGDIASWLTLQADVWLARGKVKRAISLLEEAELLSPEREDVARNLAVAYYNEHNLKKAVEQAQRAVLLAPYSPDCQQLVRQLKAALLLETR